MPVLLFLTLAKLLECLSEALAGRSQQTAATTATCRRSGDGGLGRRRYRQHLRRWCSLQQGWGEGKGVEGMAP